MIDEKLTKEILEEVDRVRSNFKIWAESAEHAKLGAAVKVAEKHQAPVQSDVDEFKRMRTEEAAYKQSLQQVSDLYQKLRRLLND